MAEKAKEAKSASRKGAREVSGSVENNKVGKPSVGLNKKKKEKAAEQKTQTNSVEVDKVDKKINVLDKKDAENTQQKEKYDFGVGDTVVVNYRIIEGEKERIQPYEGFVLARKGMGFSKTFTVRRISAGGIGVERIFPLYSPNIESIKVKTKAKVRRAKLYYMRDRVGKAATRIKKK